MKLFVFDEPTVGVDVGTRVAIYGFIRDLCESGAGVLLISSDLPEILHLTNRIYVMYRGRPAGRACRRGDHARRACWPFLRAGGAPDGSQDTDRAALGATTACWLQRLFVRLGVLPFLLVIALIVFNAPVADNFLTSENLDQGRRGRRSI